MVQDAFEKSNRRKTDYSQDTEERHHGTENRAIFFSREKGLAPEIL